MHLDVPVVVQPLIDKALEAFPSSRGGQRLLLARITGFLAYLAAYEGDAQRLSTPRDYASCMLSIAHLPDLAAYVRTNPRLPRSLKVDLSAEVANYTTVLKSELLQVKLALSVAVDSRTDERAKELVCVVLMDNALREQGLPFIEDYPALDALFSEKGSSGPEPTRASVADDCCLDAAQGQTEHARYLQPLEPIEKTALAYPRWLDEAGAGSESDRVDRLRKGVQEAGLHLRPTNLMQAPHPDVLTPLRHEMPGFGEVLDFVEGEVALSHLLGAPLKLSPILLVGPPSTGKTRFATRLVELLGLPFETFSFATEQTVSRLCGAHPSIKAACEGNLFRLLASSAPKNAFYIVDEIEKAHEGSGSLASPVNSLYGLLEWRTAREFRDDYVGVPVDASYLNWIATANDLPKLPDALRSRFQVFHIEKPEEDELLRIMLAATDEALIRRGHPGAHAVLISRDDIRILKGLPIRSAVPLILSAIGLTGAGSFASIRMALESLIQGRRWEGEVAHKLGSTVPARAYQGTRIGFTAVLEA